MRAGDNGLALVDALVTATLVIILAGVAVPVVGSARGKVSAKLAAQHVAATMSRARMEAARRNTSVALEFSEVEGEVAFRLVADTDGDGVRASDVASGVDIALTEFDRLSVHFQGATFRVPANLQAPDSGAAIAAGSDPVRFGSSAFVSFHPLGSATAGTAYLASADGHIVAVRVFGATARVRVLSRDDVSGAWRSD